MKNSSERLTGIYMKIFTYKSFSTSMALLEQIMLAAFLIKLKIAEELECKYMVYVYRCAQVFRTVRVQ